MNKQYARRISRDKKVSTKMCGANSNVSVISLAKSMCYEVSLCATKYDNSSNILHDMIELSNCAVDSRMGVL